MAQLEILELARIRERGAGERAAGLDRVAHARVIERGVVLGIEPIGDRIGIAQCIAAVNTRSRFAVALRRPSVVVVALGTLVVPADGVVAAALVVAALTRLAKVGVGVDEGVTIELGERGGLEIRESSEGVVALAIEVAEVVERVIRGGVILIVVVVPVAVVVRRFRPVIVPDDRALARRGRCRRRRGSPGRGEDQEAQREDEQPRQAGPSAVA